MKKRNQINTDTHKPARRPAKPASALQLALKAYCAAYSEAKRTGSPRPSLRDYTNGMVR